MDTKDQYALEQAFKLIKAIEKDFEDGVRFFSSTGKELTTVDSVLECIAASDNIDICATQEELNERLKTIN